MPQVPTARGVKIRSAADAHLLFYAVHLGRLPMIQRRLDATERQEVVSGAVFVWEERSAASTSQTSVDDGQSAPEPGASPNVVSGIERWTDGLKWGPSRVRDDFLFYQEKDPNDKESLISPPPVLAHSSHGPYRSQAGKHGAKLIKQTYSVHYYPQILEGKPPTEPARKWHLTAYHSVQTVDRLADVMAIPELHDLSAPPDGLFKKARVGKKTRRRLFCPSSRISVDFASAHRADGLRQLARRSILLFPGSLYAFDRSYLWNSAVSNRTSPNSCHAVSRALALWSTRLYPRATPSTRTIHVGWLQCRYTSPLRTSPSSAQIKFDERTIPCTVPYL